MRFIHTADWHLGRIFHGVHLTDDQAHVLDQLVDLVKDSRSDAVMVSGDIYDRAVPPPEAVALLDEVLTRLVTDLNVRVILIAGNHDSPERLAFGSAVLAERGLFVVGSVSPDPVCIRVDDGHGPVQVFAVPYAEPSVVREKLCPDSNDGKPDDERETIRGHDAAMRAITERIHPARSGRSVLMAHAFVTGGVSSESERPLSVGGAGAVDADCFKGFDYVALGHLHRPQSAGGEQIRYAGSLLKYSFAEAGHPKSVHVVELDEKGQWSIEPHSLAPRKDVRCIEGTFQELLQRAERDQNPEDFIMVTLLDREPVLDAMGRLREAYPNVLHVERPHLAETGELGGYDGDHRKMTDADLFSTFFKQVTGDALTDDQAGAYAAVVGAMRREEREASG